MAVKKSITKKTCSGTCKKENPGVKSACKEAKKAMDKLKSSSDKSCAKKAVAKKPAVKKTISEPKPACKGKCSERVRIIVSQNYNYGTGKVIRETYRSLVLVNGKSDIYLPVSKTAKQFDLRKIVKTVLSLPAGSLDIAQIKYGIASYKVIVKSGKTEKVLVFRKKIFDIA